MSVFDVEVELLKVLLSIVVSAGIHGLLESSRGPARPPVKPESSSGVLRTILASSGAVKTALLNGVDYMWAYGICSSN
ncbi:hypothetical protein STEG23_006760, partial [Scotinomys teguina]